MRRTFDSSVLMGLGVVVSLLVVNAALAYRNIHQLSEDASWVAHTQEVRVTLSQILRTLVDAEMGYRGFVVSGKKGFLEAYRGAVAAFPDLVAQLKFLTADNAAQQERIEKLDDLSAGCWENIKEGMELRQARGFEAAQAFIASGEGNQKMEAVRQLLAEMNADEERLLKEREGKTSRAYVVAITTGFFVAALGLAAVVAFVWLLQRSLTAPEKAAATIAEQAERLRTILASIGDAVITTDTEGRVTTMNAVAESLTGWTTGEAVGEPLDIVFRIVNEETREAVPNPATRALKEGVIVGLTNHTVLISKDGVERPLDDSAAPIRCKQGEVVGCVLVFRDITERRRLERQIVEQASAAVLLASIVESSDDAIVSKSLDGIIESWNAAAQRLFGYTAEQAIGRHISFIIPPDRAGEEDQIIALLRAGERVDHFDTVRVRRDGQPVHVSLTISPIRDEQGHIVGASKIARDITDRKRAEEALREADRRKDQYIALLAHELRNPLAPLRNGLQVMQLGGDAIATAQARDMMERQLGHMVRLIDDLLDVSRISQNKMELRRTRLLLTDVVSSAVETARPAIEAGGHAFTISLPPEPVYLDGDLTRLAQVFSNLLTNSAKYTERGGRIWLSAERRHGEAVVSVCDSGMGIPADDLPRIFDMFSQVDRSIERATGGLGIGLALVKGLVEMHNGTVTAVSEGQGKGSTFTVKLPTLANHVESLADVSSGEDRTAAEVSRRILIVDDNRDSANSMAMMLKLLGNDVVTAHDGLEAVEAAEEFQPGMILMDVGMPRLNGYEATRRIREQPWGQPITIIALTGWGQEADRALSKAAGCDGHLVKPVSLRELQKLMTELKDTGPPWP